MSKPLKIETQLLPAPRAKSAQAQAPLLVVADAGRDQVPDGGAAPAEDAPVAEPVAEVVPIMTQPEPAAAPEPALMLPVLPFWVVLTGWILCVILMAQGGKWVGRALRLPERIGAQNWSRWVLLIPLASGMVLSVVAGPAVVGLFGVEMGWATAALTLGSVSGPAAVFGYEAIRRWILPAVPTVLVLGFTRVTGIELPEKLLKHLDKASGLRGDSEAMEEIEAES